MNGTWLRECRALPRSEGGYSGFGSARLICFTSRTPLLRSIARSRRAAKSAPLRLVVAMTPRRGAFRIATPQQQRGSARVRLPPALVNILKIVEGVARFVLLSVTLGPLRLDLIKNLKNVISHSSTPSTSQPPF
jgi:hypothetical protein